MQKQTMHKQPGQSMVIITLTLVGLVAMLGLVFDVGNAYIHRRRMQNASDSGASAGTNILVTRADDSASTECKVLYAVQRYATLNGAAGPVPQPNCGTVDSFPNIQAQFINQAGNAVGIAVGKNNGIPSQATGVNVTVSSTFNTFFLGVVGKNNGGVNAGGTVQSGAFSPTGPGIEPIAIPRSYVTTSTGAHVILGQGAEDPSGSSSYRGIINLRDRENPPGTQVGCGGGDKEDAEDYIDAGGYNNNCGPLRYNDYIDVLTGNSNGNAGVDAYKNNPSLYPIGTIIIVAVYPDGTVDSCGHGTNGCAKAIGFAAMKITGYGSNWMEAQFAGRYITSGPIDPNPPAGEQQYLPKATQIIR